jgi:tetratricopeptide (TPR) repeat protein
MKIAIRNIAEFGAALLLALPIAVCAQGMAQQSQQTQQSQSQQTPPQQQQGQAGQAGQTGQGAQAAPATPAQSAPVDPAEEAAFKQFRELNTTDAKVIATSGEDFMKKYPSSRYSGAVYSRLTSAYMQLGDTDHLFAAGNKALAVMPENVDVLPVMAMATSRRIDPGALDADQKERTAKTYAQQGILLINQLQRPTDANSDQWDRARDVKLSMCHSGLGLVDYDQGKFTEAIQEFTEALKLEHDPDPVDQYLLGVSFSATKDYANASTSLEACSKQDGSMQAICKRALDETKKKAAAQPKQ